MRLATKRHLNYALGYLALGLLDEAHDELESIAAEERSAPAVLAARVEYYLEAKQWASLVTAGRELVQGDPTNERGWIGWAFALRELGRVAEAKSVLLDAEHFHGPSCAVLHYNLACYHCLLGEMGEARMRLETAFRMHPPFRSGALDDPDLERLHGELRT